MVIEEQKFEIRENVFPSFIALAPVCTLRCHLVMSPRGMPTIVVMGRARLSGFRVGLGVQNPGLATLGFSGFGLFRASGFSGLFQAFYSFFGPLRG